MRGGGGVIVGFYGTVFFFSSLFLQVQMVVHADASYEVCTLVLS